MAAPPTPSTARAGRAPGRCAQRERVSSAVSAATTSLLPTVGTSGRSPRSTAMADPPCPSSSEGCWSNADSESRRKAEAQSQVKDYSSYLLGDLLPSVRLDLEPLPS